MQGGFCIIYLKNMSDFNLCFLETLRENIMDHYAHQIISDDTRLQLSFMLVSSNNTGFPPHWHSHLEIMLIRKGYMTALIGDQKYTLKKGDLLVINSRELHSTKTWGETEYLLLQIPFDYLSRAISGISLIRFQEYFPSITMNATQKQLCSCLFELVKIYTKKEDGYLLRFSSIVYEFLYILYRNYAHKLSKEAKEKENRNFERIEEVLQYVKANYKREIPLNEVAELLNVSPEYFCRLFKKHTGQTFLEYLNAVRLSHFYQDLIGTDYSITSLMDRNGISNYKVFLRIFKEAYGASPSKVRGERDGIKPPGE